MMRQDLRGIVDEFKQGMTFQRGSQAYDRKGRRYGVNQGRFETIGARRGLLIEGAATNHIRNSSGVGGSGSATLPTNWALALDPGLTATYNVAADAVRSGHNAVDITVSNTSGAPKNARLFFEGGAVIAGTSSDKITVSTDLQLLSGSLAGVNLGLGCHNFQAGSYVGEQSSTTLAVTTSRTRFATNPLTPVASTATVQPRLHLYNIPDGAFFTVRVVAPQLEKTAYATSYIPTTSATATRNAETLTLPTTGLTPSQGTISVWVYVDAVARRQDGGTNRIFDLRRSGGGSTGMLLAHLPNGANWYFETQDDAGASSSAQSADSNTPDGWYLFTATWDLRPAPDNPEGPYCKLYSNQTLRVTLSNPKFPSGFHSTMYLGSSTAGGSSYLNARFGEVHLDSIARDATFISAEYTRGYHVPDQYTTCHHVLDGPDSQRAARSLVI